MVPEYNTHAQSFLMDEATYDAYSAFSVYSTYRKKELQRLNAKEEKLYHFLLSENRRLEQERISNAFVEGGLKCLKLM